MQIDIPQILIPSLLRNEHQYIAACQDAKIDLTDLNPAFISAMRPILASSDFVTSTFCRSPALPIQSYQAEFKPHTFLSLKQILDDALKEINTVEAFKQALRVVRAQQTSLIIWRYLLKKTDAKTHLYELSLLADMIIKKTVKFVLNKLTTEVGAPITAQEKPIDFVVIALGKLGGRELNFSSDIDLIFAYTENGIVANAQFSINVSQYFIRVAQLIISILSDITVDGFVYRVDMRLRPYGESGALVLNFNQLEQYYQYQGRDWERYALIKARVVVGNIDVRNRLKEIIRPFVYRRYLDYSAFEALREMKIKVALDVKKNNRKEDIKLGHGGIRQIEFIVQAFQLIRGGKNLTLQKQNLLATLYELYVGLVISDKKYKVLKESYVFLRTLENFLQMLRDEQTHQLPILEEEQEKIAFLMGESSWGVLKAKWQMYVSQVAYYFETLLAVPQIVGNEHQKKYQTSVVLWTHHSLIEQDNFLQLSPDFLLQIQQFKKSALIRGLKAKARNRLDRVMPVILDLIIHSECPDILLMRTLKFLRAIVRRSAYLLFLIEKKDALIYLLEIFKKNSWINEKLCLYPVLLDEIFTPVTLEQLHQRSFWEQELSQKIKGVGSDDLEIQMETLRQFKLAGLLNIALHGVIDKKEVNISLVLNHLVESILSRVYQFCLKFIKNHYHIEIPFSKLRQNFPFALIAYGKLGAMELTYASDLDVVFLYDERSSLLAKEIPGSEVFIRLAQRIIHMISTPTLSGKLFEIDVRLRPGGSAGMLVSSLSGFEKYLDNEAWAWEHQALVNARFILGNRTLKRKFELIRRKILSYPRDKNMLKTAVNEMRQKMLSHQDKDSNNVKFIPGGMVDIEFIVQYAMLYYGHQHDFLLECYGITQNLSALKKINFLSVAEIESLLLAYQFYQQVQNNKILQQSDTLLLDKCAYYQNQVTSIWNALFLNQ